MGDGLGYVPVVRRLVDGGRLAIRGKAWLARQELDVTNLTVTDVVSILNRLGTLVLLLFALGGRRRREEGSGCEGRTSNMTLRCLRCAAQRMYQMYRPSR